MTVRCSRENGTLSLSDSMKYWRISGRIDSKRNLRRGQVASIKGGTRGGREGGWESPRSTLACLGKDRPRLSRLKKNQRPRPGVALYEENSRVIYGRRRACPKRRFPGAVARNQQTRRRLERRGRPTTMQAHRTLFPRPNSPDVGQHWEVSLQGGSLLLHVAEPHPPVPVKRTRSRRLINVAHMVWRVREEKQRKDGPADTSSCAVPATESSLRRSHHRTKQNHFFAAHNSTPPRNQLYSAKKRRRREEKKRRRRRRRRRSHASFASCLIPQTQTHMRIHTTRKEKHAHASKALYRYDRSKRGGDENTVFLLFFSVSCASPLHRHTTSAPTLSGTPSK